MSALNDNDMYSENYNATNSITGKFMPFSSPYLNYDPNLLPQAQSDYIVIPGNDHQRGRFELAFSQIGMSCFVGVSLGGALGLYNGLKATTMAGQIGKLRRTQILNHVVKHGTSTSNTFGTIAVIYSAFGVVCQKVRGTDDDLNTIASATATGLLYKCTGGLRKCGLGGAVGLGVSCLYALWNNRDKLQHLRLNPA